MASPLRIAIIGAGISGLLLAHRLQSHGEITLFEKSRGVGGRLATRYAPPYEFDHGAPFFTATNDSFNNFLQPFIHQGVLSAWQPRFVHYYEDGNITPYSSEKNTTYYVGTPRMNSFTKRLADGLHIHLECRVHTLTRTENQQWHLMDDTDNTLGLFNWVIITTPLEQTRDLLPHTTSFYPQLSTLSMQPCYSLMLGYTSFPPLLWDGAFFQHSAIQSIIINSQKPQRNASTTVVILTNGIWATHHLEDNAETVIATLLKEATHLTKIPAFATPSHHTLHRWRYATTPPHPTLDSVLIDTSHQLACCGDWCMSGTVESAFTVASHLADTLNAYISN